MNEVKFSRENNRFECSGMDLNRPVDSIKDNKFPLLQNMRSYQDGRLEPRLGMTDIGGPIVGQTPVHSCRRLNDPASGTFRRVIGTGTRLAYGQSSPYTAIDSGYSGDPLAMVPYRPEASPTSYMYIADRFRMRKLSIGGTVDTIGYAPPNVAPDVVLDTPSYKAVDEFSTTTGWTLGGDASSGSALTTTNRVSTTIAGILYDVGTTGWACCWPTSAIGFGPGERLTINSGGGTDEPVTVHSVHPASQATTIASIIYDLSVSGICSITLTTPIDQIAVNALIYNSTLTEFARIISVAEGPDGNKSFRVSTLGTWAVGNSVEVKPSFRAYFALNHAAAETIVNIALRKALTYSTGTATFTTQDFNHDGAGPDTPLDLSSIASGIPTHPEDYMHISFRCDRPDLITEIRVMLDVDASANDFTRNYYMRAFRPSDIAQALHGTKSLVAGRSTVLQNDIIDNSIEEPSSDTNSRNTVRDLDQITTPSNDDSMISQQLETGENVWFDMRFRISDLIRVGTDDTRTLLTVAATRITLIYTGNLTIDMDSWWIGGGFGPDSGVATADPYIYRYRVRNPTTNVSSNWSPATRLTVDPWRQKVIVSPAQYTNIAGTGLVVTDLVLDVQRLGGVVPVWHYVGTTPNSATPSFADKYPDSTVSDNPSDGNDRYQPWPIVSTPATGTTTSVSGTSVADTGVGFSIAWSPGTSIKINGIAYTIYRVINANLLELVENAGSQSAVDWKVDEPLLIGQSLPCLWGDDALGVMFACGDTLNPGRLYWTNGNDPDTTKDSNYLDITSPSEPLMNGVIYNLRSYVFSSERMFQILPTGDGGWRAEEIPNGKGLFSRWAITRNPAPIIATLGKDGIYATTGGAPVSLTDADLYPYFPNEGNLGSTINTLPAPNIVAANQANLRLEYYDEFLYFDYIDTAGLRRTLVLSMDRGNGWFHDIYTPGMVFHYGEEGPNVHSLLAGGSDAVTASLYQYSGFTDAANAPIQCLIWTPAKDQGDPRANKLYGDIMLDTSTSFVDVLCTPYINNFATALPSTTVSTGNRSQVAIPTGTTWTVARNVSLAISFNVNSSDRPLFYVWGPRWTFEAAPISSLSWEISPTTFGLENYKHMGLVRITHVSTADLKLTLTIDGVIQAPPITILNSGGVYKESVFRVPAYKAKLWKIRLSSTAEFRLDGRDTFFEIKEWGSEGPYQQMRVFSDYSLIEG